MIEALQTWVHTKMTNGIIDRSIIRLILTMISKLTTRLNQNWSKKFQQNIIDPNNTKTNR